MKKCRTSQTPLLINIVIFSEKSKEKNFLRHFCQVLVFFRLFRNKQGKAATKALQVYILTRVFTLGAT